MIQIALKLASKKRVIAEGAWCCEQDNSIRSSMDLIIILKKTLPWMQKSMPDTPETNCFQTEAAVDGKGSKEAIYWTQLSKTCKYIP